MPIVRIHLLEGSVSKRYVTHPTDPVHFRKLVIQTHWRMQGGPCNLIQSISPRKLDNVPIAAVGDYTRKVALSPLWGERFEKISMKIEKI